LQATDDSFKENLDTIDTELEFSILKSADELLGKDYTGAEDFDKQQNLDRISRMFIFGNGCPEQITNRITQKLKKQNVEEGFLISYFNLIVPDDKSQSRIDWQGRLERLINELVNEHNKANIQNAVYALMMNELNAFIAQLKESEKELKTDLARQFMSYLFGQIGHAIYTKSLEASISHHILAEKRIVVDFHKLGFRLSKVLKHPKKFKSPWLFSQKVNRQLDVPVYGQVWTDAYLELFCERVTDNLFRTFGVNLLDPLIRQSIEYSLNTFRGEKISIEAQSQGKKLRELRHYREVLVKAHEAFEQSTKHNQ